MDISSDRLSLPDLPQWLQDVIPKPRPVNFIDFSGGLWIVAGSSYNSPSEAYHAAQIKLRHEPVDFSVAAKTELQSDVLGLFSPVGGDEIFFTSTDEECIEFLKLEYHRFLEINKGYQKYPENWVTSYHWLDLHPCFWILDKAHEGNPDEGFYWITKGGRSSFYEMVGAGRKENTVGLEAGGHTPDFKGRFHDTRLDVYTPTFEEAYIALAREVNKYFRPDGTEREDVDC